MELRSRYAGSLVDCAAHGKVSESWRADMARRTFFQIRHPFAYASCSGVPVACAVSVVHAAVGATAPGVESPDLMSLDTTAKPSATRHRRPAPGTPALGGRGDLYRAGDGLAGYGDRQRRPARHRRRPPCQPGRRGLGGQHLSDRAGCDAAAARRARRNRRSSADLSRRPAAVHAGLARLRLRMVAAQPDGGSGAAGVGRQRHHERERGAGPLRLSDPYARPRLRPQRAGGRNGVHVWPDDCLRDPVDRNMAVAVRDQYSLRRDRDLRSA